MTTSTEKCPLQRKFGRRTYDVFVGYCHQGGHKKYVLLDLDNGAGIFLNPYTGESLENTADRIVNEILCAGDHMRRILFHRSPGSETLQTGATVYYKPFEPKLRGIVRNRIEEAIAR